MNQTSLDHLIFFRPTSVSLKQKIMRSTISALQQVYRVNPRLAFKKEMTKKRLEFAKEAEQNIQSKRKEEEELKELERLKQSLQEKDILQFKQERRQEFDRVDMFVSSKKRDSTVDEIKRQNHLATLQKQRQERLDRLVHLYHSTSGFITYANMSQQIDTCLMTQEPPQKHPVKILEDVRLIT